MDKTTQQEKAKAKIRARKANRATYDLPPRLRDRVRLLAEELRIPASQLVTLALLRFLQTYDEQQIDLSRYKLPSRSPRYDWNLEFPADLLRVLRREARKKE
jgi:hypothetical protein